MVINKEAILRAAKEIERERPAFPIAKREIQNFYQQYHELHIRALDKGDQADRAQLDKAYQTAGVLFEVLCAVPKTEKVEEFAPTIIAAAKDVQEKKAIYLPYNILLLDSAEASQSVVQLERNRMIGYVLQGQRKMIGEMVWNRDFITPILHVIKEIEHERPCVAYLCRFYAFENAQWLDLNLSGCGVWQFKISLLQRLEWAKFFGGLLAVMG